MTHVRTTIDSPVGELTLIASDAGLRAVLWQDDRVTRVPLPPDIGDDAEHPVLRAAVALSEEPVPEIIAHVDECVSAAVPAP